MIIPPHPSRGGGVALAVTRNLCSIDLQLKANPLLSEFHAIDILGVKIKTNYSNFNIVLIYVPPTTNAIVFQSLFDALTSLLIFHDPVVFLGDFNISDYIYEDVDSQQKTVLSNFWHYHNLTQHNYVLNCKDRLLDLVFSNLNINVLKAPEILLSEDSLQFQKSRFSLII